MLVRDLKVGDMYVSPSTGCWHTVTAIEEGLFGALLKYDGHGAIGDCLDYDREVLAREKPVTPGVDSQAAVLQVRETSAQPIPSSDDWAWLRG